MAQNDEAKRATTVLTIAQLKFKQALRKEEQEARLPSVSVDDTSHFFSCLDAVLKQNTRVNVQKCTEWIVRHITPSKFRIAVLGDYLVSVSKSIVVDQQATSAAKRAARNRIDLLLIVNDVLHTDRFHQRSSTKDAHFSHGCASFTTELIEQASSCIAEKDSGAEKKLKAIINYWSVNQLLSAGDIKACRDSAEGSLLLAQGGIPMRKRHFLLPEYHGDRTAPWHDLPASYMLEQMIQQPKKPIDPMRIKIARLDKKPVSAHARKLLDSYFENIDLRYLPTGDNPSGETSKYKLSLDPLGQTVKQNKETGETSIVCNGYGWSMKFCQDMQKHGMPENIKVLREDLSRMEEGHEVRETSQRRPEDGRRRRLSSNSDYRRGRGRRSRSRSRSRHGSESSYDSRRSISRSKSGDRSNNQRLHSSEDRRRDSRSRGRNREEADYSQPRPPPKPFSRDSSNQGLQWNSSDGPNRSISSGPSGYSYSIPPPPPAPLQNSREAFPQPPPLPFNAPPFPFQHPVGQFPGHLPFVPPPPPQFQHLQGPGGFPPPPPPPPNFSGPYSPPNIPAMPPYKFNNQYQSQPGNDFGYENNAPRGQHQGGFQSSRGTSGGYNQSNRGCYSGGQRGQRAQHGGRY